LFFFKLDFHFVFGFFSACWQRVRVWLVALARTNLAKENEPEENPQDFPSMHKLSNWLYMLLAVVLFLSLSLLK